MLAAATTFSLVSAGPASADIPNGTQFYVGEPNPDAVAQVEQLMAEGRTRVAKKIQMVLDTPTAIWIESGTKSEVQKEVRAITKDAASKGTVPVLVLYNIPFRDCAQYSSGGATSVAEYKDWIDGVVRGIGNREAVIAVEPDGLGIIPWYTPIGGTMEWCQPTDAPNPDTAAAERFEMLNYAVDKTTALPNTSVYLDGTHDGWLGVGDISDRLIKAGVEKTDGFFLNASNYRWTYRLVKYGKWISQCIDLVMRSDYDPSWCASQYYPANPADFSTWHLTDAAYRQAYKDTGLTRDWESESMKHFIIDTSRNGQGPWDPTTSGFSQDENGAWWYDPADGDPVQLQGDPQDWCNPPGRGVGKRPTTDTAHVLIDAYVWIKVPGESDGQCSRGLGTGDNVVDPMWGQVDPDAGVWFPEQAIELVMKAYPRLVP